jgi:hypothetical protein
MFRSTMVMLPERNEPGMVMVLAVTGVDWMMV